MIYRFGKFELDELRRELREDGTRVDTEPKAFDMLVYLVQHHDRAIGKDELQEKIWPRTIVSETALTRCIMKARRAVGDDSSRQDVIRTVHGHGYQFVAPLESDSEEPGQPGEPTPEPVAEDRKINAHWRLFAAGAALLVVLVAGIVLLRDPPPVASERPIAVLPVTNLIEDEDLAWIRLGLMGLMNRMLEDAGTAVASERAVMQVIGDVPLAGPPGDVLFEKLRAIAESGPVLYSALDREGGLFRLSATITHEDGHRSRRIITGSSAAGLAADMSRVISEMLVRSEPEVTGKFASVSTDPFVNELYARALDLEYKGQYEQARDMFGVVVSQEPELFWPRYEIALCTRLIGEYDEAARLLKALESEAQISSDGRALFAVLNALGLTYWVQGDYDTAGDYFSQSLDAAQINGSDNDLATVHINLALIATRKDDLNLAMSHYESASEAFERAGREPAGYFLNNYAGLLISHGDLDLAAEYSSRAVAAFQLRGQRAYEAPALNRLAKIRRLQGDTDEALLLHEQALAIYRELGNSRGELSVQSAIADLHRNLGDLTRARLVAEEVRAKATEIDDKFSLAAAHESLGQAHADAGDYPSALASFRAADAIFVELGDASSERHTKQQIARLDIKMDNVGQARMIAENLLAFATDIDNAGAEAEAQTLLARVAMAERDFARAMQQLEGVLEYARKHDNDKVLATAGMLRAELAIETGDYELAEALVGEIRQASAWNRDYTRLRARLAIAKDDAKAARTILTELKTSAGEAWQASDEALLDSLEDSS